MLVCLFVLGVACPASTCNDTAGLFVICAVQKLWLDRTLLKYLVLVCVCACWKGERLQYADFQCVSDSQQKVNKA